MVQIDLDVLKKQAEMFADYVHQLNGNNSPLNFINVLVFGRINGAFIFLDVFDEKNVFDNAYKTFRHDRIAQGINLTTFELIDEDN